MSLHTKRKLGRRLRMFLVLICLVISLFPIYWMLNTSFKTQFEIYQKVPTMLPQAPTLDGYRYLLTQTPFLTSLKNSFIVALTCSLLSLALAYPVSYVVARMKFLGRKVLSKVILFAYLIPTSVLYIPLFLLVSSFNLTDNILGLILIYPTFTIPYVSWMLIPHVRAVPREIEEAARIDGCSRIQCMYRITFPLALPGIVSTFIFAFSLCWGEYLYALVNISSTEMKTFPLVISNLIYGDIFPWNQIMAGAILACIPILAVYILFSDLLVGGMTDGGIKA